MSRKQKIVSRFPSRKEWHTIGGYNFNGPGTQIYERVGLKYKGKVGTKSYFLPVNKLDRQAIQHDFFYYAQDDISHIKADLIYVKNLKSVTSTIDLSRFVINAQWILRLSRGVAELSFKAGTLYVSWVEIFKNLRKLFITPPYQGSGSMAGWLLNKPKGGEKETSPEIKAFFKKYFGITGTIKGPQNKFRRTFLTNIIPALFVYGSGFFGKSLKPARQILDLIMTHYVNSESWKSLETENNKVMDAYDDYLQEVGFYDKDDNFVIKPDISVKNAKRKYIKYFRNFRRYIKFVNEEYKESPDFKKYEIPTLNLDNLDKVAVPEMVNPKPIILPKVVKDQIDKVNNITQIENLTPENIKDELSKTDEILRVIKGETAEPGTTDIEIDYDENDIIFIDDEDENITIGYDENDIIFIDD